MLKTISEKLKINLSVRLKNKTFCIAMVGALLLLITQVLDIFGLRVDLSTLEGQLKAIIETIFMILALLGIVVDPTTDGVKDSDNAMEKE